MNVGRPGISLLALIILFESASAGEFGFSRDSYSFYRSSRGFLIEELQNSLGIEPEKRALSRDKNEEFIFGKRTEAAVKTMQGKLGLPESGIADQKFYESISLEWPSEFYRAAQLTAASGFEGTDFGDSVGPKSTSTKDGVTFGISGFTSYNGELQDLLRDFAAAEKPLLNRALENHFKEIDKSLFFAAIQEQSDDRRFERWGLTPQGTVRKDLQGFLAELGRSPEMKVMQLKRCEQKWKRAVKIGETLCGDAMPLRTRALFYDIYTYSRGPSGKGKPIPNTKPQKFEDFDGLGKLREMRWKSIREREAQIIDMTIQRLTLRWGQNHTHVKRATIRWNHFRNLTGNEANLRSFAIQPHEKDYDA